MTRDGLLTLHSSAELDDERFRQPPGRYRGYGYFDYFIFGDVAIESMDGLVMPVMGPKHCRLPSPAEQQRARLAAARSDPLYAALVRVLGEKNSQDAWHIRTAEANGLLCFLTMDFKLIRTVQAVANVEPVKSLRTRVMTPIDLGRWLGLRPVHPHILSYDGASFFVRSDLHSASGKRRPLKDYDRRNR